MYVIQSGVVEIIHQHEKGEDFIIERLYRGSIINHNAFIMNDTLDTNARCKTSVSLYFMNIKTLENLRTKHNELDEALYS